jgi:hypothetical protein
MIVGVAVIIDPSGLGWGFLSLMVSAVFFALMVWLGRVMLRWNQVPPAGRINFIYQHIT